MNEETDDLIVRYEHVNIYQSQAVVLGDVTMEIKAGEFIYLIGKTGTGKSSLLKTFYAELPVNEGVASVCGFDMTKLKSKQTPYLRRKLGIVFQDFQLLHDRNVYGNLDFVLKATGWEEKKGREERIDEVMGEVGLMHKYLKMPYQLSGGEQQRLAIARALLNNPILLLADEPTGNLDPDSSDEIMKLLIRINREHDTAVVMATHNYGIIDKYPSKIYSCIDSSIIAEKGIVVSR